MDNAMTTTDATSKSISQPTSDFPIVSGAPAPPVREDHKNMSPTEKAPRDADQATERMQPTPGSVAATAEVVMNVSGAVDSVLNIYTTWEKAVESMKLVVDVVNKIAEVII